MKMKNIEGQRVPDATFQLLNDTGSMPLTTNQLFTNKTVVVFSLPGAFTPTCSSAHLPRYNELAATFKQSGVDEVICLSVNDAFVMNAWQAEQGTDQVTFIPDGSGLFTQGMGALVNKDALGFGMRSWRYSMLVRDGVIEKMFIEPDEPGDPFQVSDADTMLAYINADAVKPQRVAVFTKPGCSFCRQAKQLLNDAGVLFEEVVLGNSGHSYSLLAAVSGANTAPQVFVDGELIGGSEALQQWLSASN